MSSACWLIRTKAQPQKRIFCFSYAGGGASVYRAWFDLFPPEIEICPIQLPGRETRINEPSITNWSELIDKLTKAMQLHLDIPFTFFGHSLGGLIGFEVAQHFQALHYPLPRRIFLSAIRAPHLPDHKHKLYQLNDHDFIDALRKLGGTPKAVLENSELMHILLPMLRADFTLYETYVYHYRPSLATPFTIYGGIDDPEVTEEELKQWNEHTRIASTIKMFPGDHFFIHSHQDLVIEDIIHTLATRSVII